MEKEEWKSGMMVEDEQILDFISEIDEAIDKAKKTFKDYRPLLNGDRWISDREAAEFPMPTRFFVSSSRMPKTCRSVTCPLTLPCIISLTVVVVKSTLRLMRLSTAELIDSRMRSILTFVSTASLFFPSSLPEREFHNLGLQESLHEN